MLRTLHLTLLASLLLATPVLANDNTRYLTVVAIADVQPAPAPVPAVATYPEPTTVSEAADDVLLAVKLAKTGYWMAFALVLSQLLIFAMKRISVTSAKMKKYGTFVVLGLSAIAGFLSLTAGGMRWQEALLVFLSTVAPKILNDILTEIGMTPHQKNPDGTPKEG